MTERFKVRVERTRVHEVTVDADDHEAAITEAVRESATAAPKTDWITAEISDDDQPSVGMYL